MSFYEMDYLVIHFYGGPWDGEERAIRGNAPQFVTVEYTLLKDWATVKDDDPVPVNVLYYVPIPLDSPSEFPSWPLPYVVEKNLSDVLA